MASREEMLARLKQIDFCAMPGEENFNTGLNYDYVTSLGAGHGHDNLGEWPLLHIAPIADEKWQAIKTHVKNKTLTLEELSGTSLEEVAEEMFRFHLGITPEGMSDLMAGLLDIEDSIPSGFYCLCDMGSWDRSATFFRTKQEMIDAFEQEYCWEVSPWDEMDDYELQGWYDRLERDFSSFIIQEMQ